MTKNHNLTLSESELLPLPLDLRIREIIARISADLEYEVLPALDPKHPLHGKVKTFIALLDNIEYPG